MVSEWMPNGSINEFITAYPDANRFELVSSLPKLLVSFIAVDYGFDSWQMLRRAWSIYTTME